MAVYSRTDRASALAKLDSFIAESLGPEDDAAFEAFWGPLLVRAGEVEDAGGVSEAVADAWFAFDFLLTGGRHPVDLFLDGRALPVGERAYLELMRDTSMHLYEVTDAVPGVSLMLRDVLEGDQVTVHERTGSRSISRFEWVAARLVPRGASGVPEIEAGMLHVPHLLHEPVRQRLTAARKEFLRANPRATLLAFYKQAAPFFHSAWASAILDPVLPQLCNTDGEAMVVSRLTFDVVDEAAVRAALAAAPGLAVQGGSRWGWSGKNHRGEEVSLGTLVLTEGALALEVNSVERAERGRRLVESLAGEAVRHRSTTHEDMAHKVREELRQGKAGRAPSSREQEEGAIPRELAEELVLDHYAKHYRAWVDEPVPALDGLTPRSAARSPGLRARLVELLHDLQRMYQHALRSGQPAYDASWMWSELELEEGASPAHPPRLPHERIADLVPGSALAWQAAASDRRAAPGFEDATALVSEDELRFRLDVQRLLRERPERHDAAAGGDGGQALLTWLRLLTNFELHRRKAFWVDEALAFTLDHTELDLLGRELRAPFKSFVLVFTDRHVLSLAERLVACTPSAPLAGQLLRVLTVFVSEVGDAETRALRIAFGPDALGADLPGLLEHEIPLAPDTLVQAWLDRVAPRPVVEPAPPDTNPLRGLVRIVVNAILYATSAGVEAEVRAPPPSGKQRVAPAAVTSESVYFLPGAIEISQLRRLQALERIPEGRRILRRYMVRGHWRRPAPSWTDRRLRWIAPYWKGPDLAAVIERTYRLKP